MSKISKENYALLIKQTKDFLSGKSHYIQDQLKADMEVASENLEFEKAATIRDRIRILTQIQAKNAFSNSNIDDADIIALYQDERNDCCIQVFFIRAGKNYGNRAYFPNYSELDAESFLETFIGQFYQRNHPPKRIILSHELESAPSLEEAIFKICGVKTKIISPSKGALNDIMQFAVGNAKSALIHHNKEKLKNLDQLNEIASLFGMDDTPRRIEVYDNSHTQGASAVGCMIVAGSEGFNKKEYRVFNIKEVKIGDDYSMLREVLKRRLKRLDHSNYPDLIIIDGGKGQLSSAQDVFNSFGISDIKVVCVSKGEDRNAGREFFHQAGKEPFQLPRNDKTLHYLQVIRDEAHRFAIETHRKRRGKQFLTSSLDAIPQIGATRKKILLSHFGSVEAIKSASQSDLTKVTGISKKTAKIIYDFLHSS